MPVGQAVTSGIDTCPSWAPLLGFAGASICVILANWGAAWGTWKSGLGLCKMGINHPGGIIKNLVAIIIAVLDFVKWVSIIQEVLSKI